MRTRIVAFVVFMLGFHVSLAAQWRGEKRRRPKSCALADSLLGPMRGNASVYTDYKPSGDTSYLQSGRGGPAKLRLVGVLLFPGRGPVPFPAPTLNFVVGRGRLASSLVMGPGNPDITLFLNDTIPLHVGSVPVGTYNGPTEAAIAPITVYALPAWALSLARARTATLKIDSTTLPISQSDLREFEALYRVATCDTLPLR